MQCVRWWKWWMTSAPTTQLARGTQRGTRNRTSQGGICNYHSPCDSLNSPCAISYEVSLLEDFSHLCHSYRHSTYCYMAESHIPISCPEGCSMVWCLVFWALKHPVLWLVIHHSPIFKSPFPKVRQLAGPDPIIHRKEISKHVPVSRTVLQISL